MWSDEGSDACDFEAWVVFMLCCVVVLVAGVCVLEPAANAVAEVAARRAAARAVIVRVMEVLLSVVVNEPARAQGAGPCRAPIWRWADEDAWRVCAASRCSTSMRA